MSKKVALETINHLVEEMTKAKPDQAIVKKLMNQAGLQYEADLIHQMGSVLGLVAQIAPDNKKLSVKKMKEVDL